MTISEASKHTGVSADTLRYYERIHLLQPIPRNTSGIRDYGDTDLRWIQFIKCMRSAGISIETLIEYVTLFQAGDSTAAARKSLLIEQREALIQRIADMQDVLQRLNYKIDHYDDIISPYEKDLWDVRSFF